MRLFLLSVNLPLNFNLVIKRIRFSERGDGENPSSDCFLSPYLIYCGELLVCQNYSDPQNFDRALQWQEFFYSSK
ncbi:hypothetical protein NIES2135_59500 [Leptolyngbya boryana NIES-2135]|jgi:hypothetical protein|uniref:Uncharacterized protein n=1 Tax=Leptolyngbya boryana NIES-2135 TaxID=1973484 RepID=A0A1Z4JQU1_LEPBY|nr:hypothetical protein NIES2135_59500 [Leptolyngbya boryana NIES-2135]